MPGAHPSWDSCAQGHPISSCRVQALRLVCLQSACDNGWRSTTLVPCVHVLRVHIASWHHPAVGHRGWVWGLRCQMAQAQESGLCCKAFPTWRWRQSITSRMGLGSAPAPCAGVCWLREHRLLLQGSIPLPLPARLSWRITGARGHVDGATEGRQDGLFHLRHSSDLVTGQGGNGAGSSLGLSSLDVPPRPPLQG